jgi:hypothetical protein
MDVELDTELKRSTSNQMTDRLYMFILLYKLLHHCVMLYNKRKPYKINRAPTNQRKAKTQIFLVILTVGNLRKFLWRRI